MFRDSLVGAMDSSKQLGVIRIMREAVNIPRRNLKLMLPLILLSVLLPSLLIIAMYASISPLLKSVITKVFILVLTLQKLEDTDPTQLHQLTLAFKKDLKNVVDVDLFFTITSYIISLFSMIAITYATAVTYSGKKLSFSDLLMRVKVTCKGALVTRFYLTILHTGCTVLSIYVIAVVALNVIGSGIGVIAIGAVLVLAAQVLYAYAAMVWTMGVLVSVLEEERWGTAALARAGELMSGRRMDGFLIAVILMVVNGVVSGSYWFKVGMASREQRHESHLGIGIVMLNVMVLVKVFSQMVYTVYYFECMKRKVMEGEVMLGEIRYTKVSVDSSGAGGNKALPM